MSILTAAEAARPTILEMNGDSARTRRNDRLTSHLAGDKSQADIHDVEAAVLRIVAEQPGIVGTEVNQAYAEARDDRGWPFRAWDSPRKRAGELLDAGLLEDCGLRRGLNGSWETTLQLSDSGRRTLELLDATEAGQ